MENISTVEENRRQRLIELENEFGSQVALAEKIGKSAAQISQWKNASRYTGSTKRRVMERSTARHIEKMTGKPEGWMDQPVTNPTTKRSHSSNETKSSYNVETNSVEVAIENLRLALVNVDPLTRAQAKPIIDALFADPEHGEDLGARMAKTLEGHTVSATKKKVA